MKKWIVKAVIQKVISFLPYKEKINYFFQKNITKGASLNSEYFELKLTHAKDHILYFNKYKHPDTSADNALELGTGWYPIIPISLFLAGFERIVSIDMQSWLSKEKIIETLSMFKKYKESGKLDDYIPIDEKRWATLLDTLDQAQELSLEKVCDNIHFEFIIADARKLTFDSKSFEFVCSNNTFEHIHTDVLRGILSEFKRVLKPGGVMSHFIDLSDHFAHYDSGITIYNFLKYSPARWQFIDNSIQPQNRLRFIQYREMYDQLTIPFIEEQVRPGSVDDLAKVSIHPDYQVYSKEEVAISHGYFITS